LSVFGPLSTYSANHLLLYSHLYLDRSQDIFKRCTLLTFMVAYD